MKKENKSDSQESEVERLIHELQVHEVELRMQNDELILSKKAVEEITEKYMDMYLFAPLGYFTLTKDAVIVEINIKGSNLLGKERSWLINQSFLPFVSAEMRPAFERFLMNVFKGARNENCELTLNSQSSGPFTIIMTGIMHQKGEKCLLTAVDISDLHLDTGDVIGLDYGADISTRRLAVENLKKSEKKYKDLVENAIVGIYTTDLNGKVLFANRTLWQLLEFESGDDLVNSDVHLSYKHKKQRDAFTDLIKNENQVFNYELELVTAKGKEIRVLVNAFITGELITGMMMDVTKHKLAEDRIVMASKILHLLNTPGSKTDTVRNAINLLREETGIDAIGLRLKEYGDFPYFYQAGFDTDFIKTEDKIRAGANNPDNEEGIFDEQMLDCTCGLVISGMTDPADPFFTPGGSFWTNDSTSLLDLPSFLDPRHHPRNKCTYAGFHSFALIPVSTNSEIIGLLQLNSRKKDFFTQERISSFESIGEIFGAALVRLQAEDEIRQLNLTLEQRVAERTSQLLESNREMEAFSYSVSHDLRAPLRGIHGFTQILLEDYRDKLDPEGQRICSIIQDNSLKMGRLIDDLLAFARLVRLEVQPTVIDMTSLVRAVFTRETENISRDRITLNLEELCKVPADPSMLNQVWTNLISNAIKYSSKKEHAVISVSSRVEPGKCVYCIRDNGAGFNMAHADKLFNVFQRLHNANEFDGTGVGLAIVHRIIQRHRGEVWAEGEVNAGAAFYFSLPCIDHAK